MLYQIYVIFSFSIVIAAVIGGIRFRKMDPTYHPFVLLTWLASCNEILSYIFGLFKITTNLNNNVYVLFEAFLLLWQAKKWKVFEARNGLYIALQLGLLLCWLIDAFFSHGLLNLLSIYRVISGALMVVIFIGYSNSLLFQFSKPAARDSSFLISLGLIFFFSVKIPGEIFWWQGVTSSDRYLRGLYNVIIFINLFVNLLYIIAVLWIPKKAKYTTCS